ncbi:Zn-ribbon domain-containing OB-fold protein [Paraburkholderia sp. GAS32]|uniref:Zn-ribbon domain-containing OB-fold protein n=1 Tax=Paraburkholderia sp. GAS32 TaxID=3035129 RepID=UPI003D1F178C
MTDSSRDRPGEAIESIPRRHLPRLTDENTFFWQAGRTGKLHFIRCKGCRFHVHPPLPICPRCKSREVAPCAVSGRATVASYTINHQVWERGLEAPYVIAIVEIAEQKGLRLTTNIVNCAPGDVRIGMQVRVLFDQREDVWLPLFEPDV